MPTASRHHPRKTSFLDRDQLDAVLQKFRGPSFAQMPPSVSAKKIAGRPAYELARKQQPVDLKPVDVEVYALDLLSIAGCQAEVRVHCSAGTYLRSIAHDAGQALGCGAFLKTLRRTASGDFKIEGARTLEQLGALAEAGRFDEAVIPAVQMLPAIPRRNGGRAHRRPDPQRPRFPRLPVPCPRRGPLRQEAVTPEGQLLAIGEARLPHVYHPVLVSVNRAVNGRHQVKLYSFTRSSIFDYPEGGLSSAARFFLSPLTFAFSAAWAGDAGRRR